VDGVTRIFLADLRLTHKHEFYKLYLRTTEGFESEMVTDNYLGNICSAWSVCLKELDAQRTGQQPACETQMITGTIPLGVYRLERLMLAPYFRRLVMACGRYAYTANMDRDLEHVLLAYMGAMKFFSFKLGITTLDPEVVRNRDQAGEAGLLTAEDFGGRA